MEEPSWVTRLSGDEAPGVSLRLMIQPGARKAGVVGEHDGALKIKIAAPPVEGAANEALVVFLAKVLGIRKREVTIARGSQSRRKDVHVQGVDLETVKRALTPVSQGG